MTFADDSDDRGGWWPQIEADERRAVAWATVWFYCILLSYMIVRPVRETMGSIGGIKQLQGLMVFTFVAMLIAVPLYSALVARLPRRWLTRVVYHFFAACLFAFFLLMRSENQTIQVWAARCFFVWVNVFGLFATSVFWSVLTDVFESSQAKRLFGLVAAGGTAGAITGSLTTTLLASKLTTSSLLLLPIVTIEAGLWCAWRLEKQTAKKAAPGTKSDRNKQTDRPTGGGLLAGITHVFQSSYLASICLFLVLVQACGTQLYFEQAEIVSDAIQSSQERTELFAIIDLGTQVLTLLVQAVLSGMILRRLGVSVALVILPVVYLVCFASLALRNDLVTLVFAMIATRSCGYGITVPAREVLFTVVSREEKYKSKSFIDTVVLRGGDVGSSMIFGWLRASGYTLMSLNLLALPVTAFWAISAWRLGQRQKKLSKRIADDEASS